MLWVLTFLIIFILGIKETNFALVPTLVAYEIIKNKKRFKKYSYTLFIFPSAIFLIGLLLSRGLTGRNLISPVYSSNYVTKISFIIANAKSVVRSISNSTLPFPKLFLAISPFIIFNRKLRKKIISMKYIYWAIFSLFFTIILFPWRFTLERYQLVSLFALSIILGISIGKTIRHFFDEILDKIHSKNIRLLFKLVVFVVTLNLLFRGFPINYARSVNYGKWYANFINFEKEQVAVINGYVDEGLYVNAKRSEGTVEVLYEIPLHLEYLYGNKNSVKRIEEELPDKGYIFSRTPFDLTFQIEELEDFNLEKIVSKSYYVEQIDPLSFRNLFVLRPIQTIQSPPLKNEGLEYYWEIRKI
jgi:hypothetical protein